MIEFYKKYKETFMLKRFLSLTFALFILMSIAVSAHTEKVIIDGYQGKISAVIQTPNSKKSYPMVMILHGFLANKEMDLLKNLADNLEKRGIASIRFDYNGHGESYGRFENMTVSNEIEDTKKVYEYVKTLPNVTSVSMVGHSQGAIIAGMVAGELGEDKIKCIALMSTAISICDDSVRGIFLGRKFDPINLPEYLEIHEGVNIGRAYLKDIQNLPVETISKKFKGRAYMIHGTSDFLIPYMDSIRYHSIFQNSEIHLLTGFDHNFTQDITRPNKCVTDFFVEELIDRK